MSAKYWTFSFKSKVLGYIPQQTAYRFTARGVLKCFLTVIFSLFSPACVAKLNVFLKQKLQGHA